MRTIEKIMQHLNNQAIEGVIAECHFTTPPKANIVLGSVKDNDIAGLLVTPTTFSFDVVGRNVREVIDVAVYFLTPQSQLDFDAVENMLQQDRCITAAVDMLRRVLDDRFFIVQKNSVNSALMYDVNNRNLTGVRLLLSLHERKGICIDSEPNQGDNDYLL